MVAGVFVGRLLPGAVGQLRRLEFGEGSQVNLPIAVLIWLMIYPMMLKVDFGSIVHVGRKPKGVMVTLFVNWLVKPFSMALIAYLFFRYVFGAWISPDEASGSVSNAFKRIAASGNDRNALASRTKIAMMAAMLSQNRSRDASASLSNCPPYST